MRTVVVVAHPNPAAFTHAVAAAAERGLRAAGHDVTVLDLAAQGFRAAMSADERLAYHTDTPVIDPMVAAHVDIVRDAEALVFVYPTWWSSMPAVLKGWLERVMVKDVSFRFNDKGKVRPALTKVRRVTGISTYGSPRRYVRLINDNGRRTLTRALWLSTGLRTRRRWIALYSIDTCTDRDREAFLRRVEKAMTRP